ncbi:uncharacterized protein C16orf78 homolog [Pseudonaja textilis]|uniref:uncharacterized protein C16orf78 homolog n=1 Tax=Pseudonaja textilis TaxID=8673 RepID=UPI000EA88FE7|nr:uncharacterized protein C16orf78 homolog [Pseudonaja textilis]
MTERNWTPIGPVNWLDNKRAKALRVSNDREIFQLKKIRRSLDSMKMMNESLLLQEERKVKRWLRNQASLSPTSAYKAVYYKTSNYPGSSQDQTITDTHPISAKHSVDIPWSQFGDHLSNFVSFLRLPTKRRIYDRKHTHNPTPFSGMDLPTQTLSARNANAPRNSIPGSASPNKEIRKTSSRKPSDLESTISLQEAVALFPSLQRLLAKKEKLSISSLFFQNPSTGFNTLQKKLRNMLDKDREDENFKIPQSLPEIKPEEILSCRYLRLSQSNIETLLGLCKESGIYIDLHPHMKESEIDASSVLSPNTQRAR